MPRPTLRSPVRLSLARLLRFACAFAGGALAARAADHDVRTHGAKGDGKTLDTAAIQRAIDAAASEGGGLVILPAGDYLSFSIRLRSHVGIRLDHGAILRAATPRKHPGAYDLPEPNPWDMYQDFGHSHWRNSLIWGENVEHVSITGPGRHSRKSVQTTPGSYDGSTEPPVVEARPARKSPSTWAGAR